MATIGVGFLEASRVPLLFLGLPVLIWAAFRFQRAGAATCALAVSTFAILAAARRTGPFAGQDLLIDMITIQAFNGSVALTALLLSATISEHRQNRKEIEQACRQLADMVARIATGEAEKATRLNSEKNGTGDDERPRTHHGPSAADAEATGPLEPPPPAP